MPAEKLHPNIVPLKSALWPANETLHLIDQGLGQRSYMMGKSGKATGDHVQNNTDLTAVSIRSLQQKHGFGIIDILKIDIEGSEKELFDQADYSWLTQVRCLIIELHDRMKAGCSKAFFRLSAIAIFHF